MCADSPPPEPPPDEPQGPGNVNLGITALVYDSQDRLVAGDTGDGRGSVPVSLERELHVL